MAGMEVAADKDKSFDASISESLQPTTKLSIIDHELNRHDMGRLIWVVCGAGFMLDLMWAQAYALSIPSIQREFGFSDKELGNISSLYGAGMAIGAFVWGALVDIVGRRGAFYGTALVAGIFGMCFGAMNSYVGLQVMAMMIGFGTGGNIPVNSTITLEYLPKNRFYLLTALSIFAEVGFVISTLMAYGFIPNYSCSTSLISCHLTGGNKPCCSEDANMGWRYLFFTIASITLGVFIIRFFIFPFYESPKYLVSKGNDRGAVEVVQKIASFNKRPCDLSLELLYEQCQGAPVVEEAGFSKRLVGEFIRVKSLFGSWKMARVTILVWIIWMFDYGAVGVVNSFLPTILQRKNDATQVSLEQTYADYLIIYTPGIVGAVLSVLMVRVPVIGRKWTLIFASVMMGLSLFLYTIANTQASRVALNALTVFFQLLLNSVLWGWTPEAFPTAVRGTAAGFSMVLATIFASAGPLIAAQVFSGSGGSNAVLYLAGGSVLICTLALLCLPAKDMVASRQV